MPITPEELADKRNILKTIPTVEGALEVIADAHTFSPLNRGQIDFSRKPGTGTRGELWFRNSLVWLKTIPLEAGHHFINLHSESPIYLKQKGSRSFSTDLLGLSYINNGAKLCAIELKSGISADNLIYAIAEGAINLILSNRNKSKLIAHWKRNKVDQTAWRKGNPFAKLKKVSLVVLGDYPWHEANTIHMDSAKILIKAIQRKFKIDTYVLYFKKGIKSNSKPYRLLNIQNMLPRY